MPAGARPVFIDMNLKLPDFAALHILVVGDLMLDRYWHGGTSRISPEAPVPVVLVRNDETRAGGAGNVALNIASLGAKVSLIGIAGQDEAGEVLAASLAAAGVGCRLLTPAGARTITKLRVISRHQQLIRLDFEDGFEAAHTEALPAAFSEALAGVDAVILSDYAKGTLQNVQPLIRLARERGLPVIVDPKGRDFSRYAGATVVKPNLSEFEAIVGACPDDATFIEKGAALRETLALQALVVTRSERGVTILEHGQPPCHLPTRAREVFDVTGAGDTVIAALGCGVAAGLSLHDATALANVAAGIVVGKLGTATVSTDELREALQTHAPGRQGLLESAELPAVLARARAAGERVAVLFGPFTPLDAARLAEIEAAGALGDRLLLIDAADDSDVHALRLHAALRAVDWVVHMPADAVEALLGSHAPDVLARSGREPFFPNLPAIRVSPVGDAQDLR